MGKRGPKLLVSHQVRVEELKKHDIFEDNGKVKKERDEVWKLVCDNIFQRTGKQINPRNLQIYVAQNRNNVLFDLKNEKINDSQRKTIIYEKDNEDLDLEKRLLDIQRNVLFQPVIREICVYPFSAFHWSSEAVAVAADLPRDTTFIFSMVSSFCKNFVAPDGSKSNSIFLYSLGTTIQNKFIPICQLSSEETTISLFNRFFQDCSRSDLPIPSKIILDYSWDHYNSVNSVFNINLKFDKYLSLCYLHLINNSNILPKCLIQCNKELIILQVKRWKCLSSIPLDAVKQFLILSVILLSLQNNLKDFSNVLKKILIITFSNFLTKNVSDNFEYIMSAINDYKINISYSKEKINLIEAKFMNILDFDNENTISFSECPDILDYVNSSFIDAKRTVAENTDISSDPNAYYNPQFCGKLIELCVQFIVWSNVMNINDNSSANHFDNSVDIYKQELIERFSESVENSKIAVDQYLLKTIDYANQLLQHVYQSATNKLSPNELKRKSDLDTTYVHHQENWMNKNEELKCYSDNDDDDINISDSSSESDFCDSDNSCISQSSEPDEPADYCKPKIDLRQSKSFEMECDENYNVHESTFKSESEKIDIQVTNNIADVDIVQKNVKGNQLSQKDRGKFLRPCAYINLLQQKPTNKQRNRKVLKNCNIFKPKKIDRKRKIITTSSYFDSIIEILVSSYFNVQHFQNCIQNSNSVLEEIKQEFLNLLLNYVDSLNVKHLYCERYKIIHKIFNSSEQKLSWKRSIGDFFNIIIEPNVFFKLSCSSCSAITYKTLSSIVISDEKLISKEFLPSLLPQKLHAYEDVCNTCFNKVSVCNNYEIKNILCLDTEGVSSEKNYKINLNDLPHTMEIDINKFILMGVIEFQDPIADHADKHYLAYSRSLEGLWYKYDDAETSSKPIRVKQESLIIKAALILYIKYDTN